MVNTIGSEGSYRHDLVIPQGATFTFSVVHYDGEGEPVPHEGWSAYMRIDQHPPIDLGKHVSFATGGKVAVSIPPEKTARLRTGVHGYDLMLEDPDGNVLRLVYGKAMVVDTYAMDVSEDGTAPEGNSGSLGDEELDDILNGGAGGSGSQGGTSGGGQQYIELTDEDVDDIVNGPGEGSGSGSGGGAAATGGDEPGDVISDDELLDILNG